MRNYSDETICEEGEKLLKYVMAALMFKICPRPLLTLWAVVQTTSGTGCPAFDVMLTALLLMIHSPLPCFKDVRRRVHSTSAATLIYFSTALWLGEIQLVSLGGHLLASGW